MMLFIKLKITSSTNYQSKILIKAYILKNICVKLIKDNSFYAVIFTRQIINLNLLLKVGILK